uniref:Uncharacterized protein n=1 Tax=Panagrolaimus sp. PS1159 TaxID=55785 RepID=A0AC35GH77_9BILA
MGDCVESLIELENYVAQLSAEYYLQKLNRTIRSKNENQTNMNKMKPKKCCIKGIQGSPGKNGKNGVPGSNGINGLPGKSATMKSLWDQCTNCGKRFKLHAIYRNKKADLRKEHNNEQVIKRSPIIAVNGQKRIKNFWHFSRQ